MFVIHSRESHDSSSVSVDVQASMASNHDADMSKQRRDAVDDMVLNQK